ncbi:MCE family protein [uncultured Mycobacterium sp.]|uniref:MCE family protein n=1 Tax=uncultured Mycobacterium sp. TaxID=171292 RepID=UPI0035CC90C7
MRSESRPKRWPRACAGVLMALAMAVAPSCGALREFHGANSFPLPGTKGGGPGHYTIQAQLPDVQNLRQNSRVRVNDLTVGNVTKIERQGWHALLTMTIDGNVDLPANATATLGQTSLLGSLHIELAPPKDVPPQGKLHNGSLIPLSSAGAYPSTEQTLGALSLLLNGGGLGQVQDITKALSTAFTGREEELKNLIRQVDQFVGYLNDQKDDIIAATDSLNNLVGRFADQKGIVDKALKALPEGLAVLKDERENLAEALTQLGRVGALVADSVNKTKQNLVKELSDLGPVLQSLADSGQALTRSLGFYGSFPFPKDAIPIAFRGDYANLTAIIDLTLSRLDASFFTGTRWEGNLTQLELQWGRTIGQMPSPYTARNPLVVPYHFNQGP